MTLSYSSRHANTLGSEAAKLPTHELRKRRAVAVQAGICWRGTNHHTSGHQAHGIEKSQGDAQSFSLHAENI